MEKLPVELVWQIVELTPIKNQHILFKLFDVKFPKSYFKNYFRNVVMFELKQKIKYKQKYKKVIDLFDYYFYNRSLNWVRLGVRCPNAESICDLYHPYFNYKSILNTITINNQDNYVDIYIKANYQTRRLISMDYY